MRCKIGGTEIRVDGDTATLFDGENAVCSFRTSKAPRNRTWALTL